MQSVVRAFVLLEALAAARSEVPLAELAKTVGLAQATTHRLLRTMLDLGYVHQGATREYALGPGLISLGARATPPLVARAQPVMIELEELAQETVNLAVLDGAHVVYVGQVPSRHQMRMFTEVGRRLLPHGTGVGKAMLAHLPSEDVTALLARTGMPSYTEHTFTDEDALLRELAKIAQQGYALDEAEQELGVRCVAVAVPGAPVPAAVSVSGPSGRLTMEAVERIAPVVQRIATSLGSTLSKDGVTV